MTAPIHTIKHVKNTYRKYQIFVFIFALVTIAATFLAAISGVKVALLRKQQISENQSDAQPSESDQSAQNRQLQSIRGELAAEKTRTGNLLQQITDLKSQVAALKKPSLPAKTGQPSKPATPQPKPKVTQPPKPKPASQPTATKPAPAPVAKPTSPEITQPDTKPVAAPEPKPAETPKAEKTPAAIESGVRRAWRIIS